MRRKSLPKSQAIRGSAFRGRLGPENGNPRRRAEARIATRFFFGRKLSLVLDSRRWQDYLNATLALMQGEC